jgi:outer membrane protein
MNGKRVMRGIGLFLLIMAGGVLGREGYPAELKVGTVDIQKAINECVAGREAKRALSQEIEQFERLTSEKQKGLQDMQDSLEKQGIMLTPDARKSREMDLQTKIRDFKRWEEDRRNEISQKRLDMEKTISVDLLKVIQKIGADEGYTFILEKNETIVLFSSQSLDITDRVTKSYDARKK